MALSAPVEIFFVSPTGAVYATGDTKFSTHGRTTHY
jgi:hypothetical protein